MLLLLLSCTQAPPPAPAPPEKTQPCTIEVPYDGMDNDCDANTPDDDLDGDGYPLSDDCDDQDANRYVGAEEIWYDGIDEDCEGGNDFDQDGDGFEASG